MEFPPVSEKKPDLPRLIGPKKRTATRGIGAVTSSLQQLFSRKDENVREVIPTRLEQFKKTVRSFFSTKPHAETPSQPRHVENKTEVISVQPSRKYCESVSQERARSTYFTPEYLIKESPKEIVSPIEDETNRCLRANIACHMEGTLEERGDGLFFLRLDDALYERITAYFEHATCVVPDFDFRMGPSIPVIFPYENPLGRVFAVGKTFSFSIKRATFVTQYEWPGVEKTLILSLNAPELSRLRQSHGLCDRPDGRDFHITVGIVRTDAPHVERGFLRVHVGYHPV